MDKERLKQLLTIEKHLEKYVNSEFSSFFKDQLKRIRSQINAIKKVKRKK